MQTLKDKRVLVTGASRGIGFAAALEAARRGARIAAVARTAGGLEELDDAIIKAGGNPAILIPFDLGETDSIDQIGYELYNRWGRLDAIIGNAAMLGQLTPVHHIDPEQWQKIMAVNVTANYRLIRTCDPLLRKSDNARVVFVTSGAAKTAKPYWGMYSATKAALDALVMCYAGEVDNMGIKVNLFSPGATRTKMRAAAMPGEDPTTLPSASEVAIKLVDMIEPGVDFNAKILSAKGHVLN